MQAKKLVSIALLLSLSAPGARSQAEFEPDEVNPPASKFPGVGSFDNWKASLPLFQQGQEAMKQHQWDQAIAAFKASLDQYPYQWRAHFLLGRATERKGGRMEDAEAAYRESIKLEQNNWRPWKALANVLYVEKRYGQAREALTDAMELHAPKNAHDSMAKLLEAIDAAQHNADTQPENTP
jgi:Flp pilus assembly protein TadD